MADDPIGFAFPLEADPTTGRIKHITKYDTILQSIKMILSTKRGERFLNDSFGCDLYKFMFSSVNYTTLKRIEQEVISSITAWEDRIEDLDVAAEADNQSNVVIHITYTVDNRNFKYTHKLGKG